MLYKIIWSALLACKSHNRRKKYKYKCELTVRHCVTPQITSHHNNNIPQRYIGVWHTQQERVARPSITLNKKIPTQSQNFYCLLWRIFFPPTHIFHSTIIFFCILSFIICIFCAAFEAAYHRSSYKLHLRCKKKTKKKNSKNSKFTSGWAPFSSFVFITHARTYASADVLPKHELLAIYYTYHTYSFSLMC